MKLLLGLTLLFSAYSVIITIAYMAAKSKIARLENDKIYSDADAAQLAQALKETRERNNP